MRELSNPGMTVKKNPLSLEGEGGSEGLASLTRRLRQFCRMPAFAGMTILFISMFSGTAHADCTNPARVAGVMIYNQSGKVLQFCDGTNWQAVATAAPTGGFGACTAPVRAEGTIIYNADQNVPQLCASGSWVALGPLNPGAGSGGCASPARAEGVIIYNADSQLMQYCDGSAWIALDGPEFDCPGPGDTCADGTVFAALSPDGNVRMYVTRCDAGMSWDGSNCTGTRLMLPWNDNNGSGYTQTGEVSESAGDNNTANLIVADANSNVAGLQPHRAALYCHCLGDAVAGDCASDPTGGADGYGHTDWYLPANEELDEIYENLQDGTPQDSNPDPVISGFATSWYWSSTEADNSSARAQDFSNENDNSNWKYQDYIVRCARKD